MKNKIRIALFSPSLKTDSGIALYNHRLINYMSENVEFHLINNDSKGKLFRSEFFFKKNYKRYDKIIYHLGNSKHHFYMLKYIDKYPGILVLHEEKLDMLISYSSKKKIKLSQFKKNNKNPSLENFLYSSKHIIVHSNFLKKIIETKYNLKRNKITKINHFNSKKMNFTNKGKFFCTFGHMHKAKDGTTILKSWLKSRLYQKYKLIFVGKIWRDDSTIKMREIIRNNKELKKSVIFTNYVSKKKFDYYLNNTIVAIQLRKFTRGENSGVLVELLSRGKIVILNNIGAFKEVPNNCVIKIPKKYNINILVSSLHKSLFYVNKTNINKNISKYLSTIDISEISKKYLKVLET